MEFPIPVGVQTNYATELVNEPIHDLWRINYGVVARAAKVSHALGRREARADQLLVRRVEQRLALRRRVHDDARRDVELDSEVASEPRADVAREAHRSSRSRGIRIPGLLLCNIIIIVK